MQITPTNAERMPSLKDIVEAFTKLHQDFEDDGDRAREHGLRLAASFALDITHLLNQQPWLKGAKIVPQSAYDAMLGALRKSKEFEEADEKTAMGDYSGAGAAEKLVVEFRTIRDAALALVAPQPDTEESDHEQATRERKGGVR